MLISVVDAAVPDGHLRRVHRAGKNREGKRPRPLEAAVRRRRDRDPGRAGVRIILVGEREICVLLKCSAVPGEDRHRREGLARVDDRSHFIERYIREIRFRDRKCLRRRILIVIHTADRDRRGAHLRVTHVSRRIVLVRDQRPPAERHLKRRLHFAARVDNVGNRNLSACHGGFQNLKCLRDASGKVSFSGEHRLRRSRIEVVRIRDRKVLIFRKRCLPEQHLRGLLDQISRIRRVLDADRRICKARRRDGKERPCRSREVALARDDSARGLAALLFRVDIVLVSERVIRAFFEDLLRPGDGDGRFKRRPGIGLVAELRQHRICQRNRVNRKWQLNRSRVVAFAGDHRGRLRRLRALRHVHVVLVGDRVVRVSHERRAAPGRLLPGNCLLRADLPARVGKGASRKRSPHGTAARQLTRLDRERHLLRPDVVSFSCQDHIGRSCIDVVLVADCVAAAVDIIAEISRLQVQITARLVFTPGIGIIQLVRERRLYVGDVGRKDHKVSGKRSREKPLAFDGDGRRPAFRADRPVAAVIVDLIVRVFCQRLVAEGDDGFRLNVRSALIADGFRIRKCDLASRDALRHEDFAGSRKPGGMGRDGRAASLYAGDIAIFVDLRDLRIRALIGDAVLKDRYGRLRGGADI